MAESQLILEMDARALIVRRFRPMVEITRFHIPHVRALELRFPSIDLSVILVSQMSVSDSNPPIDVDIEPIASEWYALAYLMADDEKYEMPQSNRVSVCSHVSTVIADISEIIKSVCEQRAHEARNKHRKEKRAKKNSDVWYSSDDENAVPVWKSRAMNARMA